MVCVFPGCALVLARDLRFIRPLMREDFPTLLLPANANSIYGLSGILLVIPQTVSRLTFLITMLKPHVLNKHPDCPDYSHYHY